MAKHAVQTSAQPDRYLARVGFDYPADAESLRVVREAGGRSKLTPEQRARVVIKSVAPGEDCSDMPVESLAIYLARGKVVRAEEA